jgi:hypothetical protein
MRLFFTVILATCCIINASSRADTLCSEQTGGGAIFYNFDKIVVLYSRFPGPDEQSMAGYPVELKYEAFTQRLTEAVKRNFAPCLVEKSILGKDKEKPVIFAAQRIEDIYDRSTLTIIMDVDYRASHPASKMDVGTRHASFFRPGLSPQDAIWPMLHFDYVQPVFGSSEPESLEHQIQGFLNLIRPVSYDTSWLKSHPEYRGPK